MRRRSAHLSYNAVQFRGVLLGDSGRAPRVGVCHLDREYSALAVLEYRAVFRQIFSCVLNVFVAINLLQMELFDDVVLYCPALQNSYEKGAGTLQPKQSTGNRSKT